MGKNSHIVLPEPWGSVGKEGFFGEAMCCADLGGSPEIKRAYKENVVVYELKTFKTMAPKNTPPLSVDIQFD